MSTLTSPTQTIDPPPSTTLPTDTKDNDPLSPHLWTPSQELTLLQLLTRLKPVGLHKHFRLLAIHQSLLSSGTIPHPVENYPYVSTPEGIWRKLGSLYDLAALDEREDGIFEGGDGEENDGEGDEMEEKVKEGKEEEYWREFELVGDGFEREMWGRRLVEGKDEEWSDDDDDEDMGREVDRDTATVGDSEEGRSSPITGGGDTGSVRGTRSSGRRAVGKRLVEVKQEGSVSGRAGSRRTSKAASPSVAGDDTEMQDVDGEEGEDGTEDEEGDSEAGDTEDDRKGSRSTRGRGNRRGTRGRRGRRGK